MDYNNLDYKSKFFKPSVYSAYLGYITLTLVWKVVVWCIRSVSLKAGLSIK